MYFNQSVKSSAVDKIKNYFKGSPGFSRVASFLSALSLVTALSAVSCRYLPQDEQSEEELVHLAWALGAKEIADAQRYCSGGDYDQPVTNIDPNNDLSLSINVSGCSSKTDFTNLSLEMTINGIAVANPESNIVFVGQDEFAGISNDKFLMVAINVSSYGVLLGNTYPFTYTIHADNFDNSGVQRSGTFTTISGSSASLINRNPTLFSNGNDPNNSVVFRYHVPGQTITAGDLTNFTTLIASMDGNLATSSVSYSLVGGQPSQFDINISNINGNWWYYGYNRTNAVALVTFSHPVYTGGNNISTSTIFSTITPDPRTDTFTAGAMTPIHGSTGVAPLSSVSFTFTSTSGLTLANMNIGINHQRQPAGGGAAISNNYYDLTNPEFSVVEGPAGTYTLAYTPSVVNGSGNLHENERHVFYIYAYDGPFVPQPGYTLLYNGVYFDRNITP